MLFRSNARQIYPCNCNSPEGCNKHLDYLKTQYGITWKELIWGIFDDNRDFLLGPSGKGIIENLEVTRIVFQSNVGIVQSSDTRNFKCCTIGKYEVWNLYECKICHMWIYAVSKDHVGLVLNNSIENIKRIPDVNEDSMVMVDYNLKIPI